MVTWSSLESPTVMSMTGAAMTCLESIEETVMARMLESTVCGRTLESAVCGEPDVLELISTKSAISAASTADNLLKSCCRIPGFVISTCGDCPQCKRQE